MKRLLEDPSISPFERSLLETAPKPTLSRAVEERVFAAALAGALVTGGAVSEAPAAAAPVAGAKGAIATKAALGAKSVALVSTGIKAATWIKLSAAVILVGSTAGVGAVVAHRHSNADGARASSVGAPVSRPGPKESSAASEAASEHREGARTDREAVPREATVPVEAQAVTTAVVKAEDLPAVKSLAKDAQSKGETATRTPRAGAGEPRSRETATEIAPREARLLAEARILAAARKALAAGDFTQAEALLREASSYNAMSEERALIGIELLRAKGMTAEADREERAFRTAHPASVHVLGK